MILSGSFAFIGFSIMKAHGRSEVFDTPLNENLPEVFHLVFPMFKFFDFFALLQVILASGLLISAIKFLKLREWARKVLEGFGWLSLALVFLFTIFWIVVWTSIVGEIPDDQSSKDPIVDFTWIGPIMVVIFNGLIATAYIFAIRILRSPKVTNAMIH